MFKYIRVHHYHTHLKCVKLWEWLYWETKDKNHQTKTSGVLPYLIKKY